MVNEAVFDSDLDAHLVLLPAMYVPPGMQMPRM